MGGSIAAGVRDPSVGRTSLHTRHTGAYLISSQLRYYHGIVLSACCGLPRSVHLMSSIKPINSRIWAVRTAPTLPRTPCTRRAETARI